MLCATGPASRDVFGIHLARQLPRPAWPRARGVCCLAPEVWNLRLDTRIALGKLSWGVLYKRSVAGFCFAFCFRSARVTAGLLADRLRLFVLLHAPSRGAPAHSRRPAVPTLRLSWYPPLGGAAAAPSLATRRQAWYFDRLLRRSRCNAAFALCERTSAMSCVRLCPTRDSLGFCFSFCFRSARVTAGLLAASKPYEHTATPNPAKRLRRYMTLGSLAPPGAS